MKGRWQNLSTAPELAALHSIRFEQQFLGGEADRLDVQRAADCLDRRVGFAVIEQQLRVDEQRRAGVGPVIEEQLRQLARRDGHRRRGVVRQPLDRAAEHHHLHGDVDVRAELQLAMPDVAVVDALAGGEDRLREGAAGIAAFEPLVECDAALPDQRRERGQHRAAAAVLREEAFERVLDVGAGRSAERERIAESVEAAVPEPLDVGPEHGKFRGWYSNRPPR